MKEEEKLQAHGPCWLEAALKLQPTMMPRTHLGSSRSVPRIQSPYKHTLTAILNASSGERTDLVSLCQSELQIAAKAQLELLHSHCSGQPRLVTIQHAPEVNHVRFAPWGFCQP